MAKRDVPGVEQSISCNDGRRLTYSEYGDPCGLAVMYAHGAPGSRLEGAHFHASAADQGIRLICIDRPGIGGSDFCPHYRLTDYPQDVGTLADHLGLDDFAALGWSSGGPYVLSCAQAIPERLRCALVMASYSHFAEFEDAPDVLWEHDQIAPVLAMKSPFLLRTLLNMIRMAERHAPSLYLELIKRSSSPGDLEILQRPGILQTFLANQDAAFRQGIDGVLRDLYMEYQDWGFRLVEVQFPVLLIQGREDRLVPWLFADHLARSLPLAEVSYLESEGHMFPLDPIWQQALWQRIRDLWEQEEPATPPSARRTFSNGARIRG